MRMKTLARTAATMANRNGLATPRSGRMTARCIRRRAAATLLASVACAGWIPLASADSAASPLPARGEFVIYEDTASGELLKGPLDGSGWQTFAPYRRGQDGWSRLAAGRQLALYRSASARNDTVTVYDVASGQAVLRQEVPKHTVVAGPVFGNPDHYLLRTYVGASDGGRAFVVDLRAGKVLNTLPTGGFDTTIEALPDGRLYRVHAKTGAVSIAGADGAWSDVGRLSPPAGATIGNWRLSHQGKQIAVVYQWFSAGAATRSDVWIANIDGSNPHRLTHQGYMGHPVWSPDDSRLAFNYDTSSMLGGLTGRCTYWQVPANAQNLSGISADQPHAVAAQMRVNLHAVKNYSPCNIVTWER
jgi:hypothetical protein